MLKLTKNAPVIMPKRSYVDKKGYVLWNENTFRKNGYTDHRKIRIGKAVDLINWKENRMMYPNDNYFSTFNVIPPLQSIRRFSYLSIGAYVVIRKLAEESGLLRILCKVFEEENAYLLLDLAMFMLVTRDSVFQPFPEWARSHATFSKTIRSGSYISNFGQEIPLPVIEEFKFLWAQHIIGRGKVFLCYDSTNVNSQAEGAALVERGHAKDNPKLPQVNTDYVVRQEDGIPVTFAAFPGSITDVVEAPKMIEFLKDVAENDKSIKLDICVIADRGYISEENIKRLDKAGLDSLLMLKSNQKITSHLIGRYSEKIKTIANRIPGTSKFAKTIKADWLGRTRYFHIIFNPKNADIQREQFLQKLDQQEQELEKIIRDQIRLTENEVRAYGKYFELEIDTAGMIKQKKLGRGKGEKESLAFRVKSMPKKEKEINKALRECGFYVLVTSSGMTAQEALKAYSKRDGIEKMFRVLKNSLGMDAIRVHSNDSIRSKMLIWFLAGILYSLLFLKTKEIRDSNKNKSEFTMPEIMLSLQNIMGLKVHTEYYKRSDPLEAKQKQILKALKISERKIDEELRLF